MCVCVCVCVCVCSSCTIGASILLTTVHLNTSTINIMWPVRVCVPRSSLYLDLLCVHTTTIIIGDKMSCVGIRNPLASLLGPPKFKLTFRG